MAAPESRKPQHTPDQSVPSSLMPRPAAAAVLTGVAVLLSVVALARPGVASAEAALAPTVATSPVMVVLDASGSMTTADAPGPRITAAKQAVYDLVDSLPAGVQIGLLAYGTGTDSSDAAKTVGCQDIKQVVGLGTVNKTTFKAAVAGITARGYTPIGNALKSAAAKLPSTGPRSIVLVSDGEDTCAPPAPCDVAKQLNSAGADLTVHTIGFKVNDAARAQLNCIAAATKGTYRETSQGGELGKILINQVGLARRPYTPVGTRVTGSTASGGAPELKPGQYVDSFASTDTTNPASAVARKFYTVTLGGGETLHASMTLAVPPVVMAKNVYAGVSMDLLTLDGDTCASTSNSAFVEGGKIRPFTTALSAAPGAQSASPSLCDQKRGQFVLEIRRTGAWWSTQSVPGEIRVGIEPVADADGLPAPAYKALPSVSPAVDGTPVAVDGGSSFSAAPVLRAGTYKDLVVSGETRYYRMHVGYGQRLTYRISIPGVTAAATTDSVYMRSFVTSPIRETVASSGAELAFYRGTDAETLHGSGDFPARFTNRVSANTSARAAAEDGDYYLVLSTGFSSVALYQIPLVVTVALDGTAERGPVYGQAGGIIPTATPSATPTPTASGSGPAGSSSSQSGGGQQGLASHGDGGVPIWVWPAGAAVVLAALGAGIVVVRRRRTVLTQPPAPTDQFTRPMW